MQNIFNNKLIAKKRDLIANTYQEYNFIKKEATKRLLIKLTEIKKTYHNILDIGSHQGEVFNELKNILPNNSYSLFSTDSSINMLKNHPQNSILKILTDAEQNLPFKNNSFDLIISVLSLHTINNLNEYIKKIYQLLKPNGVFLASFPAYNSLSLLSEMLYKADLHIFNGISPKIYPFTDIKTLGNLFFSNNFQDIVADQSTININYTNHKNIFKDLKFLGETNSLQSNSKYLNKDYLNYLNYLFIEHKKKHKYHQININLCNIIAWKAIDN